MLFRLLPVQGQMADQQLPLGHTDEPATSVGHSQVGLPMLLKVKFPSSLTRQESVKDNAFGGHGRERPQTFLEAEDRILKALVSCLAKSGMAIIHHTGSLITH